MLCLLLIDRSSFEIKQVVENVTVSIPEAWLLLQNCLLSLKFCAGTIKPLQIIFKHI